MDRRFCARLAARCVQVACLYIGVKQGDGERWVEHSAGRRRFFAFYSEREFDERLMAHGFAVLEGWIANDSLGRPERWINRLATARPRTEDRG